MSSLVNSNSSKLLLPTLKDLPQLPSSQGGASVSGIVLFLLCLGVVVKLSIGIIPAQVGNYQLKKMVTQQLKASNNAKESPKQFEQALEAKLNMNSAYRKADTFLTITDTTPGQMSVHTEYQEVNNFFGDVDIVNRFSDDITAADAAASKD